MFNTVLHDIEKYVMLVDRELYDVANNCVL